MLANKNSRVNAVFPPRTLERRPPEFLSPTGPNNRTKAGHIIEPIPEHMSTRLRAQCGWVAISSLLAGGGLI